MDAKIKEIQEYFKQRIIVGDYTIVKFERHYIVVDIDGYKFNLWIGSGMEYFGTWESVGGYAISLPDFTKKEQASAWIEVSKYVDDNKEQIRKQRINTLETELNTLETELKALKNS